MFSRYSDLFPFLLTPDCTNFYRIIHWQYVETEIRPLSLYIYFILVLSLGFGFDIQRHFKTYPKAAEHCHGCCCSAMSNLVWIMFSCSPCITRTGYRSKKWKVLNSLKTTCFHWLPGSLSALRSPLYTRTSVSTHSCSLHWLYIVVTSRR